MPESTYPTCEHQGCANEGIPCWLPDTAMNGEQDAYFCYEHCYEEGFCSACGTFNSGITSFDFNNPRQLCDNCRSIDDAEGDEDEFPWVEPAY